MGRRKKAQKPSQPIDVKAEVKEVLKPIYALLIVLIVFNVLTIGGYYQLNKNISGVKEPINQLTLSVEELDSSIKDLQDNSKFSEISLELTKSVVVVLARPVTEEENLRTGAIYVDDSGNKWNKGTGFVIRDDGLIVTVDHVIKDAKEVKIIVNGVDSNAKIEKFGGVKELDIGLIKTNLTLKPVILDERNSIPIGSKVAFIGFPLVQKPLDITPIIHDGIISSTTRYVTDEFGKPHFLYTINSFINQGNSGGPVYLADSGKVVGMINARQYPSITFRTLNPNKPGISEDNKVLAEAVIEMANLLSQNQQMGIGYSFSVNKNILNIANTYFPR